MKKTFPLYKILIAFFIVFVCTCIWYMVSAGFFNQSGSLTSKINAAAFSNNFTYPDGTSPQISSNKITVDLENDSATITKTITSTIFKNILVSELRPAMSVLK